MSQGTGASAEGAPAGDRATAILPPRLTADKWVDADGRANPVQLPEMPAPDGLYGQHGSAAHRDPSLRVSRPRALVGRSPHREPKR